MLLKPFTVLLLYLHICWCEIVLQRITGEVEAGKYIYYLLKTPGNIKLKLQTTSGDADLYVSDVINKPTYDLTSHSLSSTTCGEDSLTIPADFNRPVGIGIYGYSLALEEVSSYTLYIIKQPDTYDHFLDPFAENLDDDEGSYYGEERERPADILLSVLWNVLEMLFEVFIL